MWWKLEVRKYYRKREEDGSFIDLKWTLALGENMMQTVELGSLSQCLKKRYCTFHCLLHLTLSLKSAWTKKVGEIHCFTHLPALLSSKRTAHVKIEMEDITCIHTMKILKNRITNPYMVAWRTVKVFLNDSKVLLVLIIHMYA